jgi:radical SAM protein with 4Fe4S-binding SPASM domain
MKINRFKAPLYVQFELTERCNNKCYFCYNPLGRISGDELSTQEVIGILTQLHQVGVFRINFNGGEPLIRSDFLQITEYAHSLGFELHMNTNSTLVTPDLAKAVARYMKSVCTSVLSSNEVLHDKMTGRTGAYKDVMRGIDTWRENSVEVEVNVCTSTENYADIYNIGELIAKYDCYALCSTRYILNSPDNKHLLLNRKQTEELIDLLFKVKDELPVIRDVSLPGPVPYCEVEEEYYEKLRLLNVPCQYGYGLARISPVGIVTPCTISDDEMGNLRASNFSDIWLSNSWDKYTNMCHIPDPCEACEELSRCRGGCVVYDQSMVFAGIPPETKKWEQADE